MKALDRAHRTIRRQVGTIQRLKATVHALTHFIRTDTACVQRQRRMELDRKADRDRKSEAARAKRDERNRKAFERIALRRTA